MRQDQSRNARGKIMSIMKTFFVGLCGIFLLAGCQSYETRISDYCQEFSWTTKSEETETCVQYSYRWFLVENEDGTFSVRYNVLNIPDVEKALESTLSDYEAVTDYKFKGLAKYIDYFGLRPMLERARQVLGLIHEQVRGLRIKQEFQDKMGLVATDKYSEEYDISQVLLYKAPSMQTTFISGQIEAARAHGTLTEIEQYDITLSRKYDRKAIDPDRVDDPESFVWKSRDVGLELRGYKTFPDAKQAEKPLNNLNDYIEGYRVVGGVRESSPALKVFFPRNSASALVVIDSDLEKDKNKEFGYDIPDFFLEMWNISSVTGLLQPSVVDMLYPTREADKVTEAPKEKEIKVEIAHVGTPTDLWENAPTKDGWKVPFPYRNDKEDNYSIAIKFKETNNKEIDRADFRELEYIAKNWNASSGDVVEYYHPRKEFAGGVSVRTANMYNKELTFVFPDGRNVTGNVFPGSNIFIESEPYATAFTEAGKRWWLEKSEGSEVFDKRKETSSSQR